MTDLAPAPRAPSAGSAAAWQQAVLRLLHMETVSADGAPVKLAQLWSDTSAAQVGNDLLIHGTAARSNDDVRNNKAGGAKGHMWFSA